MTILVCPLSRVSDIVESRQPNRVISILDPDFTFPDLGPEYDGRYLRLRFHDVHASVDGAVSPSAHHIDELLCFLSAWENDSTLLIHCRAGIGRSPATAFVAACWRNPNADEWGIARILRRLAPLARPNETLVTLADTAMKRDGRMSDAIAETGRELPWIEVHEGVPFEMPSVHGDAGSAQ